MAACNRGPANLAVACGRFRLEATSNLEELLDRGPDVDVASNP